MIMIHVFAFLTSKNEDAEIPLHLLSFEYEKIGVNRITTARNIRQLAIKDNSHWQNSSQNIHRPSRASMLRACHEMVRNYTKFRAGYRNSKLYTYKFIFKFCELALSLNL